MTSAPAPPCVPSDAPAVPRGSAECQTNAAKSRQQSDWFAHDHAGGSGGGEAPRRAAGGRGAGEHLSVATNGSNGSNGVRPESARKAAGLSSLEDRCSTPNSKRTYARPAHKPGTDDTQSWYKYGTDHRDVIIGHPAAARQARGTNSDGSKHSPPSRGRPFADTDTCPDPLKVKEKMTACDSNDWFRHEHAPGETLSPRVDSATSRTPGRKPPASPLARESVNSPLWSGHADVTDSHEDARATPRPEAAEYLRRNKAGTSCDWFPHEHASSVEDAAVPHAHKGSKESAENAVRSKGESQTWFAHDANPIDPRPPQKFSSPEAKMLMERACGGEMKQVFRMDQNLKTTWSAPSNKPLVVVPQADATATATNATAANATATIATGNVAAESVRALMDKFLQNQSEPSVSNGTGKSGTSDTGKSATAAVESNGEYVD